VLLLRPIYQPRHLLFHRIPPHSRSPPPPSSRPKPLPPSLSLRATPAYLPACLPGPPAALNFFHSLLPLPTRTHPPIHRVSLIPPFSSLPLFSRFPSLFFFINPSSTINSIARFRRYLSHRQRRRRRLSSSLATLHPATQYPHFPPKIALRLVLCLPQGENRPSRRGICHLLYHHTQIDDKRRKTNEHYIPK
jgi:hypothetical protein